MRILNLLLFAVLGAALGRLNDNDKKKLPFCRVSYWVAMLCAVGINITAALIERG